MSRNHLKYSLFNQIQIFDFIGSLGGGFTLGTAMGWTSPALPHIADCQDDCDFQFDDITGNSCNLLPEMPDPLCGLAIA